MISKFNKYIIMLFIKYTLIIQVFIGVITLLTNTAMHTKMSDRFNAPFIDILFYDLLKVPYLLYSTMPMSIVFSTMFVMITIVKTNELLAYVTLGGKIRNMILPFVYGGAGVAMLLIMTANYLNPKVMYFREAYAAKHIFNREMEVRPNLTDIWMKLKNNKFIHITAIDPEKMEFHYVTEYNLDENLKVESIETYNSAKKSDDKWRIFNMKQYTMLPIPQKTSQQRDAFSDKPVFDELSEMPFLKPQYVSISDIYKIAEVMKNQRMNITKYEMQIYKIFAHSLSVIVIIMTIFPLCINFNRNQSYIRVAVYSISVGFTYWMLVASCLSLGKNGVLGPFTANFFPIILFSFISAYLIYRREHAS